MEASQTLTESERRYHLENLARLPSTESIQAKIAKQPNDKWLAGRLRDALERDALQADRPAGCWCLGLGESRDKTEDVGDGRRAIVGQEWCSCPEGTAAQQDRQQQENREKQERIETAWETADIPARFWSMTLKTSPLSKSSPFLMKRISADLAQDTYSSSWFFHGAYGVGKTGLAVGYARAWIDQHHRSSMLFRSLPKLLSEIRATYNKGESDTTEEKLLARYQRVGLFILDDIGSEQVTNSGWMEDRLYQIIGDRHDEERATIFTSNLTLAQLAQRIGERLTWRILEMCGQSHIIEVKGPNLRDTKVV